MSEKDIGQILDEEPGEEQPEVETSEVETPEEPQGPERDEHGRFKSKETGEEAGSPPEDRNEFEGAATVAERRRRQEADQRAEQALSKIAELENQIKQLREPPAPPAPPPDMFEDPQGFTSHIQQQYQQGLYNQTLTFSEKLARIQHGDNLVDEAVNWGKSRCDADPYFNQQVAASGDPVGYVVKQYQREQVTNTVTPEDLAAFEEWKKQRPAPPKAPQTISNERGTVPRAVAIDTEPPSLEDLLR